MKKLILIMTIILALVFTACSAAVPEPAATPEPTPTLAPTPEPTPSPEPTLDPAIQEKLKMAPEINGLVKKIREKDGIEKVVYIYQEGNEYGGEVGEYAGEFKKEVVVVDNESGKVVTIIDPQTGKEIEIMTGEVGGVVLKPDVVKWWIDFVKPDSRFICYDGTGTFAIPLDISSMNSGEINISYGDYNSAFPDYMGEMILNFNSSLPIICTSLGREDIDSNYILGKKNDELYLIEDLIKNYNNGEDNGFHDVLFPLYNGRNSRDYDLVTRYIYFIGDFKVNEKPLDSRDEIDFGKFIYGEKMCEVDSVLTLKTWGFGIIFNKECLMIDGKFVFLGRNDL